MENLFLDPVTALNDFCEQLSTVVQSVWEDYYPHGAFMPSTYDVGIDKWQDAYVANHRMDSSCTDTLRQIDYWQSMLHHPELHQSMSDEAIKAEIARLQSWLGR